MTQQVFISHAGSDADHAAEVALHLEGVGIGAVLDRQVNKPGDDFLQFMEQALADCDYCILLWSKAAAQREWVRLEWQAALHRTVKEARRFLIAARLEEHPLPRLLAPRLFVDFFPALKPGIDEFIAMCVEDRTAMAATGRAIGQPTVEVTDEHDGETVYVTSDLFQLTVPLKVLLSAPAGILLDRLVTQLSLPRQHDVQGMVGVRYNYRLISDDRRLARDASLESQGIRAQSILWLEVEMTPFASRSPIIGATDPITFREGSSDRSETISEARRALTTAVTRAGLGF